MGTVTANCEEYCEMLFPLKGEHSISQLYPRRKTVKTQIRSVSQLDSIPAAYVLRREGVAEVGGKFGDHPNSLA